MPGRTALLGAALRAALIVVVVTSASALMAQDTPRVVASCDFEGPYSAGDNQIQDGCSNNWQWGRKDMSLRADASSGRPGTAQMIQVRGISSGRMQFFYTKLQPTKGRYYRVSYWLKADGLEGRLRCYVRKIGYPWTQYLDGEYQTRGAQWRQYSYSGQVTEDVSEDLGVCWETGSLGTIWLDDLKVEESSQPFPDTETEPAFELKPGNLLGRSSFEGRRDRMWSTLCFGASRDGVWEGVEADWEDPQMYRAPGGKVGQYCMAVPSATHAGQAAALSTPIKVLPGRPYTLSMWMKASTNDYPCSASLLYFLGPRHHQGVQGVYPRLTTEWQRVTMTCTPLPPPDAPDSTRPIDVVVQIAPNMYQQGTVYVDGLQLEAGEDASDYHPAHPLELYADLGQDGGNLMQWGQKVALRLLAASADASTAGQARIEVRVVAYPNTVVWSKSLRLAVNKETVFTIDPKRHGLFRVEMRAADSTLAAPQEMLFAMVPPTRNTGRQGTFGTHIAIRPFLVSYIRRLGFTWTRLHDCSLLTKWSATEREPGKLLWHDEVVDGVIKGGLNILGLPDDAPEWAKGTAEAGSPVDAEAYGRYCEEVSRHYAGRIDHWEIWNEPYMAIFFSGGPDRFNSILLNGSAAVRRGNPEATVVGWCADISTPAWGSNLSKEARASIDVFSFHSYPNSLCGGGTLPFAAELPEHKAQWPPQVKECWNTEGTNYDVCANSFYTDQLLYDAARNARATAFASRVWVEHLKNGISKFFAYTMHNTDSLMYNGGYQSLLIGYDRTPTPAAIATATTAYCIDGLKPATFQPLPGVVQGLFGGSRATWVVYDDSAVVGRKHLRFAGLPKDVRVLDVMGNDPRLDGLTDWEIGTNPLFVMSDRLTPRALAAAAGKQVYAAPDA